MVLFVLFVSLSISAQEEPELNHSSILKAIESFDNYVKEQMVLDNVPGLSVGFMKDDFLWFNGYGYSDLENLVPIKPESAYRLASITKTITAISILQLVEERKVDLDAEVQTYVPYFPKKKWPVTVRLLLGHLGGISHYKDLEVEGRIKVSKNTKEALAIFQDFDLVAEPGTKYNYSSYGYNLLGAVIEGASGQSYGDYIKKHIFEPLGMNYSRIDDPIELISNRVRGYRLINGKIINSEYVDISSRFAAGGTRSTVVDLLKYAKGIIEGKLLEEKTTREMFTSMATQAGSLTGYGMGWGVRPWKGHFQVSHGGSQPETRTYILIFPKEEFAIAIASNLERLSLMPYVRRLAELVLEEDLDSVVYVTDREGQVIYDACESVFSYGLSRFDWHGKVFPEIEDLSKAFSYFNTHVNHKALMKDFKETKKEIEEGIQPLSEQAFTRIGSFMALTLQEANNTAGLHNYHEKGPIAFFSDYIKISKNWQGNKKDYKFKKSFVDLISRWGEDWKKTYTDAVRHLYISQKTDFSELESRLIDTFGMAKIYPDFSREMSNVARLYLKKDQSDKTIQILNFSAKLYPRSPGPLADLAAAHIWKGDLDNARLLYKKAFALDPTHPSLRANEFRNFASVLQAAKKIKELFIFIDLSSELFPKNANLQKDIADLYFQVGQKEKAVLYYKKALEINPKLKEVKEKLKKLEKERLNK